LEKKREDPMNNLPDITEVQASEWQQLVWPVSFGRRSCKGLENGHRQSQADRVRLVGRRVTISRITCGRTGDLLNGGKTKKRTETGNANLRDHDSKRSKRYLGV